MRIARRCLNRCVERDRVAKAEMIDIGTKVIEDLGMMGEVRIVCRNWKVFKGKPPFGRIDMKALITGRLAIGIAEIPVSANVIRHLKAVIGNAKILEPLGRGKP